MPIRALNGVANLDSDSWGPEDHGFKAWAYDPAICNASTIIATAGRMYTTALIARAPFTLSSVFMGIQTAGATLANVGFAIYNSAFALQTSSVNANGATAAAFQSTGTKQVTFSSPPTVSGIFYVGFWFTGTTMPTPARSGNQLIINANLAAGNSRFGQGASSLTTTAPSTLTLTAGGQAYWIAAA